MRNINKSAYLLPIALIIGFLFIVGTDIYRRYLGEEGRPFTKGLYKKNIAGRITEISLYKNKITLRLEKSDSTYSFLPRRNFLLTDRDFWDIVKDGDSLWKKDMSDTIYTLGQDSIVYSWTFLTKDTFGRSYKEDRD